MALDRSAAVGNLQARNGKNRRRRAMSLSRRALAWVALAAATAFSCTSHAATWDDVIAAAKKEGSVTVYTTGLGASFHNDIAKSFKEKYGITVNLLDLRASEIRERVRIEQVGNRSIGDVIQLSPATFFDMKADGSVDKLPAVPNEKNLDPAFPRDEYSIPSEIFGFGILVNTRLVPPQDEPKSWQDLLNPKWTGKILADDVRTPGGGEVFFEATLDKFGEEFHRGLSKQKVVFTREIGGSERRVAMGEYPLRLPQHLINMPNLKGLPVKFIAPSEGLTYIQFNSGILRGAPHPNAALLLINHYLEAESQTAIADAGLAPVVAGIKAKSGSPDLQSIKLMGTSQPGRLEKMLALAKQIYQ
jgi:iron(III) transport system substrate-binding protein